MSVCQFCESERFRVLSEFFLVEPTTSEPFNLESIRPDIFFLRCPISRNSMGMLMVITNLQDVSINMAELKILAKMFARQIIINYRTGRLNFILNGWSRHKQLYTSENCDNITLDWLFVLNALNFSLWNPKNTKQWTVCGQTGYMALHSAIKRAIDEGRPIWNPTYYSKITSSELEFIFRGDDETTIPLIDERVMVLQEIGTILLDKFEGTFMNCIEICQSDGIKLVHLIYKEFESFRDEANYEGIPVFIGSKVTTLLADLRYFHKIFLMYINSTIFVDYRSPQVFLRLGILSYSDRLMTRLENNEPLQYGSREELEIRCCSLNACSTLVSHVEKICNSALGPVPDLGKLYIPVIIDNFLWLYRHKNDKKLNESITSPYHNVRSIYY